MSKKWGYSLFFKSKDLTSLLKKAKYRPSKLSPKKAKYRPRKLSPKEPVPGRTSPLARDKESEVTPAA